MEAAQVMRAFGCTRHSSALRAALAGFGRKFAQNLL
jgi:hypothetical protein